MPDFTFHLADEGDIKAGAVAYAAQQWGLSVSPDISVKRIGRSRYQVSYKDLQLVVTEEQALQMLDDAYNREQLN